ncbi:MAG: polysaccharide biosynthesis protein [Neisseriaceae bacterium]|nr:polysaccharide biosynthesis protein [Neisseriaceae bacterium]
MNKFLNLLIYQPRWFKKIILLIHDIFFISSAFILSFAVRLNPHEVFNIPHIKTLWLLILLFSIIVFIRMGLYRAVLRYASLRILNKVMLGSIASVAIMLAVFTFSGITLPRSVPILYFLLCLVFLTGSRFTVKGILELAQNRSGRPVIIYGAGQSGRQLLESIKQVNEYYPVAFVDDNPKLHKLIIADKSIYPPSALPQLVQDYRVEKILLSIPSATIAQRKNILHALEPLPCEVLSIPGMKDLVDGKVTVNALKKISVNDLLGREKVEPDLELLQRNIYNKNVLITGAGGSIGSELCRQILSNQPQVLVLFELSEFALYSIYKELEQLSGRLNSTTKIIPLLGNVLDKKHLTDCMNVFAINTVYHAAAYKHVPLVEYNTTAGVLNNVFGTLHCAMAAQESNVETFVLISTDKAVRPTNTMGASKRMAELILQALAATKNHQTIFCMVRFGNVLGSSGSVIPLFEKQIAVGGPVTITHQEITRFFMTIPEAAELVLQAGAMAKGGDVFVLDMGESVKIIDLARKMIKLSGNNIKNDTGKEGDIEIQITGLRPGEKLYEEVLIGENVQGTQHPRIMSAQEKMLAWESLSQLLETLHTACVKRNADTIRAILLQAPTDFSPTDEICDLLHQIN